MRSSELEAGAVEQRSGRASGSNALRRRPSRQAPSSGRRGCVMLDVIPVVEAQQVVEAAVVTRRAVRVLVVTLQRAQTRPARQPGRYIGQKNAGCTTPSVVHRAPRSATSAASCDVTQPPGPVRMVRKMAIAPQRLRNPEGSLRNDENSTFSDAQRRTGDG